MGVTSSTPMNIVIKDEQVAAARNLAILDSDTPGGRGSQNFLLIWIDANINASDVGYIHTLEELRGVVNDMTIFTAIDRCVTFLQGVVNEKIFVITSGSLGRDLLPKIDSLAKLETIYVFCNERSRYKLWAKKWFKIKGVCNTITSICQDLQKSVKQCNQDSTPFSFIHASETDPKVKLNRLPPSFMYTQLFKEIIIDIHYDKHSRRDLITYCCAKYGGNPTELELVDQFKREYRSEQSI